MGGVRSRSTRFATIVDEGAVARAGPSGGAPSSRRGGGEHPRCPRNRTPRRTNSRNSYHRDGSASSCASCEAGGEGATVSEGARDSGVGARRARRWRAGGARGHRGPKGAGAITHFLDFFSFFSFLDFFPMATDPRAAPRAGGVVSPVGYERFGFEFVRAARRTKSPHAGVGPHNRKKIGARMRFQSHPDPAVLVQQRATGATWQFLRGLSRWFRLSSAESAPCRRHSHQRASLVPRPLNLSQPCPASPPPSSRPSPPSRPPGALARRLSRPVPPSR